MDEDETPLGRVAGFGAFGIVASAFFISELGDKTQLATVSLAGREADAAGVWLGSTLGMVLADALAVGVGLMAGNNLPMGLIGRIAAALFVVFGTITIASAFV